MKARSENRIGEPAEFSRRRTLKVCVLYEEMADWERAWLMLDHLHTSSGVKFKVDWYSFDELPMLFDKARDQATEADVLLVANARRRRVPKELRRWLEAVRSTPTGKAAAVIGLFTTEDSQDGICPWELLLEDIALATGRDLFIRTTEGAIDSAAVQNVFDNSR